MARASSKDGQRLSARNPYTPDAGARPPMLAGRDAELSRLRSVIAQLSAGGTEQHVLIAGLRGVGKTVLLNEFERFAEEAGWPAETKESAGDPRSRRWLGASRVARCCR